MFRVGEISYLNCTPLFTALRSSYANDGYCFVSGHPAELNAKLRGGEIDLCPSSSIEYAQNPDKYLILPDLSISSNGEVKSVILFSTQPIETLDGASIGLTGESETSVVLLKILLAMKYSFVNSYYKAAESDQSIFCGHDALLLIGDRALAEASKAGDAHVYDLGELWQEFTGLPFVFALWLLREDAFQRSPQTVRLLHDRVVRSKERAVACFPEIALSTKQNIWADPAFLISYWNIISYDLTIEHLEGLKLFYRYAAKCGFIDFEPQLRFMELDS